MTQFETIKFWQIC